MTCTNSMKLTMNKSSSAFRWIVLTLGVLLMLCSGLVFAWSIFSLPIEQDLGLTRQQTSLIFPLSLSISIGGQILSGILQNRFSIKLNLILAGTLSVAGFILSSFAKGILTLYIGYGVLVGLAIGIIFNTVLSTVTLFFLEKSSSVTGLLLMSFGLGTMVLGMVANKVIILSGWRTSFRIFAVIYGIILFTGSLVLYKPTIASTTVAGSGIPPKEVVKDKTYWLFFIWLTVLSLAPMIVTGHAALAMVDTGANMEKAALSVSIIAIANTVSRFIMGANFERWGQKATQAGMVVAGFAGSAFCLLGYSFSSFAIMITGYIILGAITGGAAVFTSIFIQKNYGQKYYGLNLGITNIHLVIASFVGSGLAGAVKTKTGSYTLVFLSTVIISIVSALLAYLQNKQPATNAKKS